MTDSEKLDFLIKEMVEMKNKVTDMDNRITRLDSKVTDMDNRITRLDSKVTDIQLHLENVTDKNIQTVAEGHLDLSRKLDNSLKSENEKELLIIRVRMLEDELRKVKERLEQIA